jgi:hypothetical protein
MIFRHIVSSKWCIIRQYRRNNQWSSIHSIWTLNSCASKYNKFNHPPTPIKNENRYNFIIKRNMGGYIEDAQIASLGLEIYQDIHGAEAVPAINFVIPHDDNDWPVHLWGYELGVGVEKHISKFLHKEDLRKREK